MISVQQFVFNDFQENTYLLYDESGDGLIVDPGCSSKQEKDTLTSFIREKGIKPRKIINTHAHIDHVLGVRDLALHYSIPFLLHRSELPLIERSSDQAAMFGLKFGKVPAVDGFLDDNQIIGLGENGLLVLHVPGHSPGGIALYCREQGFVIAGDVLFSGSIGRADLPGGDHEALIRSIKTRLMTLDDSCVVYPGHGPVTSIGTERHNNPFLI